MGLAFKRLLGSLGGARDLTLIETILSTESANLIGYWPLSETPASQEYLTFNGTSTKANMGSAASLDNLISDGSSDLCIDFWINPTDITSVVLISKDDGSYGFRISTTSGGAIRAQTFGATTNADSYHTGTTLTANSWIHITVSFKSADNKFYIAYAGTWLASYTKQDALVDTVGDDSAENLEFGNVAATGGGIYTGLMGFLRISDNLRYDPASGNFTPPARTTIPTVDANTVGLWPMNEGYGSVAGDLSANGNDGTITDGDWGAYPAAVNAQGVAARNGAYTGVTLGQSVSPFVAPLFDGVNDFTNIYSASLAGAFSGVAGTAMVFGKVSGAGVWTDGTARRFLNILVDANNYVNLTKSNGNNIISWEIKSGGTGEFANISSITTTDWLMIALTWDKAGSGNAIAYYNGTQSGAAQAIDGTWAGSPSSSYTVIGANTITASNPFDGYLAHCAIWTKALSAAQILAIYQASGLV